MWAEVHQIVTIWNFCYKSVPNGALPLSDFYKIRPGGGSPRSVPSHQISPLWLSKCRFTGPKITKIGNFWHKFAQKGYIPLSDF